MSSIALMKPLLPYVVNYYKLHYRKYNSRTKDTKTVYSFSLKYFEMKFSFALKIIVLVECQISVPKVSKFDIHKHCYTCITPHLIRTITRH